MIIKKPSLIALGLCLASLTAHAESEPVLSITDTVVAPQKPIAPMPTPIIMLDFLSDKWNTEFSFKQNPGWFHAIDVDRTEHELWVKSNEDESRIWAIVKTKVTPGYAPAVVDEQNFRPQPPALPYQHFKALELSAKEYLSLLELTKALPTEWPSMSDNGICDIGDQVISFQDQVHRIIGSCGSMDNLPKQAMLDLVNALKALQRNVLEKGIAAQPFITPIAPIPVPNPKEHYNYVGNWQAGGICTASLIAPSWALTAKHCVGSKVRSGKIKPVLSFGMAPVRAKNTGKVREKRKGVETFFYPGRDLALVKLNKPVTNIMPVKLLASVITPDMPSAKMTVLGKLNKTAVHKNRPVRASKQQTGVLYHSKLKGEKSRPGKAGYSGGPWVIEDPIFGHVQIGVNQGGGRGFGVGGKVAKWIESTLLKESGETAAFINKNQLTAYTNFNFQPQVPLMPYEAK